MEDEMGLAHILYVYDDGIRDAKSDWEKYKAAVGEAVLTVTVAPHKADTENGLVDVRSQSVLNHGNCVNLAGRAHSTDLQIYVWVGNCLQKLADLETKDLEEVKSWVEEELQSRRE